MFLDRLNAWLDKLNDKIEKFNEKMDKGEDKLSIAVDRLKNGYTSKDYDSDYQKYITKYSDMSSDELEKEKFLIQSSMQTRRKDEGYSGVNLLVSSFLLIATLLINFIDLYSSNLQISQEKQKLIFTLFSSELILMCIILLFAFIAGGYRQINYSKIKQRYRLQIKIINSILNERKINSEKSDFKER